MRKRWTILFLCAFMAIASFGGAAMFSVPQADAAEDTEVIQLITEPVTSTGNANLDWRQAVTFAMGDKTIKSGDVLTLTYTIDQERGPAMTVGGVSVEGLPQMTTSGTWTYTFTDDYSGDILFGVYTSVFTVNTATLTPYVESAPEETPEVIQLITEPVTSTGNANLDWRQAVTFAMGDKTIKSGDVLTLTYTIDQERGPAMTVGGVSVSGLPQMTTSGTWTYTFTDDYSGDILFGVYTSVFTVNTATLTLAEEKESYNEAVFAGVTQEPAENAYAMGDVTGEIKTDGLVTYGQFDDDTYYIIATDATATTRVDLSKVMNLEQAYLDEAVLKFSAKFDFASDQNRTAELRIMYSFDSSTDRNYTVTRLDQLTSFKAGEWVEYSLPLHTLSQQVVGHTWGGEATGWFDWSNFRGVGFTIGSTAGEDAHNVVSFGNVRIEGEKKDREITGLTLDAPTKTEYLAGDVFDPAGMKVYVSFDDEAKVEVHNYTVEAPAELSKDSVVKVKWETFETAVPITVTQEFVSLKIETAPAKTSYKAGEKIDLTGMVMKAVREDETEYTVEIDDEKLSYTYQGQLLPEDAEKIEFTYKGVSTSLNITVSEFDNSIAMFGEDCLDEDGDPADGWNISSIGNNVVSKATYDAATEEEQTKMRQIGVDDTEGMYLIAEASDWAVSRVFEAQVADFNLLELYDPDYQAMLAVRYRAQSKTGTFSFGLANFYSSWNLGFKTVDVTSYVIADGEWHTMYIDIGLFYGDIDGTLWTDSTISGAVDFTKIAGFAVKCTKESLDIAGVEIKWNGAADAVTLLDSYAPQVTYNGAMTFTFEEGEQAPEFEATAFDNKDGAVEIIVEWPDGAVTDGKLNAGKHTVRLYAKDAAGNESSPYNITVTVTEKETEPPTDGDKEPGGNENPGGDEPAEKGCFSSVVGSVAGLAVLAVGGAALALRKKRQ